MDFFGKEVQRSYCGWNMTEEDRVVEMVKSMMNWLTHLNFEKVTDQLVSAIRGTPSPFVLKSLVSSIFYMAVADDSYSLFGKLCVKLSCELPQVPSDESSGKHITFKKLLLSKCRIEFDKISSATEIPQLVHDDKALRLRLVRIVRLVAELFKCRLASEKTCQSIIQVLMKSTSPLERNIEAIYRFLSSIGTEVDTSPTFQRLFDAHFKGLDNLMRHPLLSPCARDMILKLTYLRASNLVFATSKVYPAGDLETHSSKNLCVTQSLKDISEKLDSALMNLRLSEQKLCEEHTRRDSAEKDATAASLKAEELESKYTNEARIRKETEDLLCREREEMEMMKELFQSYKLERENMKLQKELYEGKYNDELRLRKETEDALAREREELEKMKQLLETCKEVQSKMQVERDNALKVAEELEIKLREGQETPSSFLCPITQDVMQDPHVAADGFTYEAQAIKRWLGSGHNSSPMTNLRLSHSNLVPNLTLRSAIQDWVQHHH